MDDGVELEWSSGLGGLVDILGLDQAGHVLRYAGGALRDVR